MLQRKKILFLVLVLILGIFLRFYNLNWGAPYYFNPDERQNVVYPVLDSQSLFMLDQKNFDTGTFPLIVIKIIHTSIKPFFEATDPTKLVLLISRGLSAIISVAISIFLFLIAKRIFNERKAILAFLFSIFGTGLIQFAHFGTIELWEAFFFLILFYYAWKITNSGKLSDSIICGLLQGLAVSTKVLSLILAPAILVSYLLFFYHNHREQMKISKNLQKSIIGLIAFGITTLLAFGLTSVPMLTNFPEARHSINFESEVALGKLAVFYTQGFYKTTPILFQFTKVFPFLLNPVVTFIFLASLIYVLIAALTKRHYSYLLVTVFFLLLFVSQSFFFVKWTRYMVPALPFVYIIIGIALDDLLRFTKNKKGLKTLTFSALGVALLSGVFFSASFFITTYLSPPTPIAAANFLKSIAPNGATILTEPYDLGVTAIPPGFTVEQFNFYELDNNSPEFNEEQLDSALQTAEYIVLPSQRILRSRLQNPDKFPKGHAFYTDLASGRLRFEKIYETPCDLLCEITYLGNPVFSFEETATVFDRPTVFIFKRI